MRLCSGCHALLLALVLLASCKERTPTQIVLSILTNLNVPAELDTVSTKVEHRGKLQFELMHPLEPTAPGAIKLPATLVLLPGAARTQPVLITVTGRRGGKLVTERKARLPFVEGRALLVQLALLRQCMGVPCPSDQTCTERGCSPFELDPATLPDYTPERALRGLDASSGDLRDDDGPRDGPPRIDGPPVDLLARDGLKRDSATLDGPFKTDAPRPDLPRPDAPKPDAPKPDAPRPDAPRPDTVSKPDTPKQDTKPDACKPKCVVVCGHKDGCGGDCYANGSVEPCSQADTYRCVLAAGGGTWPRGTHVSQVCQYTAALGGWYWMNYNHDPSNCEACCGYFTTVPSACKYVP